MSDAREALKKAERALNRVHSSPDGETKARREALKHIRAALADGGWRDISTAAIAAVLCKSGKFETGQGTCAPICMSVLGDARKHPCPHREKVFETLAAEIADALRTTPSKGPGHD